MPALDQETDQETKAALAQVGIWRCNVETGVLRLDEIACTLFGFPPGEPVTREALLAAVHPDDGEALTAQWDISRRVLAPFDAEYRVLRPSDGRERWICSRGGPAPGATLPGAEMIGVCLDVTERKRAELALRRAYDNLEAQVGERARALAGSNALLRSEVAARQDLLRRLLLSQEDERRRLSRELHDQMGQGLTALLLGIQALEENPTSPHLFESLREIGDALARQLHEVALDLRPTALDDLGLVTALGHYVERWSQQSDIPIDFYAQGVEAGDLRLRPEVETVLYRIAQEALNNVARHAQAGRVSVLLERLGSGVALIIEDDGVGFDAGQPGSPPLGNRLGLVGMRERAALVDGTVEVESTPGSGTTVFARIASAGGGGEK